MFRTLMLVPMVMLALVACGGSTAPNTETAATAAATQTDGYTSLPQSTTADGYYVLGKPDAPVLMMHYSDFL